MAEHHETSTARVLLFAQVFCSKSPQAKTHDPAAVLAHLRTADAALCTPYLEYLTNVR